MEAEGGGDQGVIVLVLGTFTKEGTYKGVQSKLEYLKNELGVTVLELLPLADWPGRWNWGYDGVRCVCMLVAIQCTHISIRFLFMHLLGPMAHQKSSKN